VTTLTLRQRPILTSGFYLKRQILLASVCEHERTLITLAHGARMKLLLDKGVAWSPGEAMRDLRTCEKSLIDLESSVRLINRVRFTHGQTSFGK
jgi:hypothetical protein